MQKSGLESLEKTASEFIAKFDELTGVEKRDYIERMIAKIVIKKDKQLEFSVLWDIKKVVTRTTKSSISESDGGEQGRYANLFSSTSNC